MPQTRKGKKLPGMFLPSVSHQGQIPSSKQPFTAHVGVDQAVKKATGMAAEGGASARPEGNESGLYINFDGLLEQLGDIEVGARDNVAKIVVTAVEAAVKAALPAIVQAVRDACIKSMRDSVNPHLLRVQFKHDDIQQELKRENIRLTGLAEGEEETEDDLVGNVRNVAREIGVDIQPNDISTCHRVGKRSVGGRSRQTIVRFISRRKRDAFYQARFQLKGKANYKSVFINEDLTPMRYAVLMKAKEAPNVKSVTSKFGNIVCKLENNEHKIIRTPDDLFEIGLDNVAYSQFKLHFLV